MLLLPLQLNDIDRPWRIADDDDGGDAGDVGLNLVAPAGDDAETGGPSCVNSIDR